MSERSVSISFDTAILMAMERLRLGDAESARQLSQAILQSNPGHGQAAVLDLWLAIRSGDQAAMLAAIDRVARSPGLLDVAPRVPPLDGGVAVIDPWLRKAFGDAPPPATDVSDHLGTLFYEAVAQEPRLMVELGTRGGESTRALLAAAAHTGAHLLSIDIEPCGDIPGLPVELRSAWSFVQSDDVAFGRDHFAAWCQARGLPAEAPVLFIDTSHEYEHTRKELDVWLPKVPAGGVAMFHDTAMDHAGFRNGGTIVFGWDNQRGVIRAIEERLGIQINERAYSVVKTPEWLVRHDPKSSGFTVLRYFP
ncbi:MAG: class I SAM-dependent methyltransferase [Alphaproteobacteria bacterium]|nr:class I SAM-dependent methyltransferase [Alphaproteobacteria bacterium]